jgi:hypothetical protein
MEKLVDKVVLFDGLAGFVVVVSDSVEKLTVVGILEVVADMTGFDDVSTITRPEDDLVTGILGIMGVVDVLDCRRLDNDSVTGTSGISGMSGMFGWSGWSGVVMAVVVDGIGVIVVSKSGEVVTSGSNVDVRPGSVV